MVDQNWDNAWNTSPVSADLVSAGDEQILNLKNSVLARGEVEHDYHALNNNFTDSGRHKTGSARSFFIDEAVTGHPTSLMLPSNAGAWPPALGDTDRNGVATLDNGRLWVDWDDCQPYVCEFEQTGGAWTDLNTNHGPSAAAWVSLWQRTWSETDVATDNFQTIGANNTREPVDGNLATAPAWAPATALGIEVTIPDDGRAYQIILEANCRYVVGNGTVGGFWLVEEDASGGGPADRDFTFVYGPSTCADEATLRYVDEAPTNGETYYYYVEVATTDNAVARFNVNPTDANGFPNVGGDFAGLTSWSRIHATISPYTDDPAAGAPSKPYTITV